MRGTKKDMKKTMETKGLDIQEAVNSANEGNTIYVKNSIYHENIGIDKPISLMGDVEISPKKNFEQVYISKKIRY